MNNFTIEDFQVNRYLVFAYDYYDSSGGLSDIKGSVSEPDEVINLLNHGALVSKNRYVYDYIQILDTKTNKVAFISDTESVLSDVELKGIILRIGYWNTK